LDGRFVGCVGFGIDDSPNSRYQNECGVEEKMCGWPNQQANSDTTNANYTIAYLH
jgi:hypothetical protein